MIQCNLQNRPIIQQTGVSIHGRVAKETYRLPSLWCLHLYQYTADVYVDDTHYAIRPGTVTVFPPGVELEYHFRGHARHLYAHFRLSEEKGTAWLPRFTDDPQLFPHLLEGMYDVVRRFPVHPLRAEITFWDLLWNLEQRHSNLQPDTPTLHPVFLEAREQIELGLGEALSVRDLAKNLEISHNQLTRIFRKETGETVADYIQHRRAKRAEHLLRDTDLPIKSVGIQVGYTDPHHFNKFIHRAFGSSPSELRRKGQSE